jgi:hypothetical protein
MRFFLLRHPVVRIIVRVYKIQLLERLRLPPLSHWLQTRRIRIELLTHVVQILQQLPWLQNLCKIVHQMSRTIDGSITVTRLCFKVGAQLGILRLVFLKLLEVRQKLLLHQLRGSGKGAEQSSNIRFQTAPFLRRDDGPHRDSLKR